MGLPICGFEIDEDSVDDDQENGARAWEVREAALQTNNLIEAHILLNLIEIAFHQSCFGMKRLLFRFIQISCQIYADLMKFIGQNYADFIIYAYFMQFTVMIPMMLNNSQSFPMFQVF